MINYEEMEQVVVNLKNLARGLKNLVETQNTIDQFADKIDESKSTLEKINSSLGKHFETIEAMEKDHSNIANNLEAVIQDYKKLNSAFELVEIELKKIASKNEDFSSKVSELVVLCDGISKKITDRLLSTISTLSGKIDSNTNELKKQIENQNKNSKIRFWAIIAGVGILAVLAIINLFV